MGTPRAVPITAFCVAVSCFCLTYISLPGAAAHDTSVLWSDYAKASSRNGPITVSQDTPIPVPYFESVANVVKIHMHGFVAFGCSYNGKTMPSLSRWPFYPKILAAFWTYSVLRYDKPIYEQYIYVDKDRLQNVTKESSLVTYVKNVIDEPEFEPLFAIAATWVNVTPTFYGNFPNDTATFQVIIATDSQVTYAIRGYQTVWQSPELEKYTYHSTAYSLGNGQRPHLSIPGSQTGPEMIKLSTKTPNRNAYDCVANVQAVRAALNLSLTRLHQCPCHKVQADKDPQFEALQSTSTCYQSRSPMPGSTLLQVCCYNEFGIVINFTKEASIPISVNSTDRSLQETYEKCCDGGLGLCRWFYRQIPSTKCTNNMTLLGVSELPRFTSNLGKSTMYANHVYTFRLDYKSENPVILSVSTSLSSAHGFTLVLKGVDQLKNLSYPQKLILYLTDTQTNMSAAYAPLLKLCLCKKSDQCVENSFSTLQQLTDFETEDFYGFDKDDRGNVNVLNCDCQGNGTGRYCDIPVNPCDDCLVESRHDCATSPMNYCPPCPVGYQREGPQCLDINSMMTTTTSETDEGISCHSITSISVLLFATFSFLSISVM